MVRKIINRFRDRIKQFVSERVGRKEALTEPLPESAPETLPPSSRRRRRKKEPRNPAIPENLRPQGSQTTEEQAEQPWDDTLFAVPKEEGKIRFHDLDLPTEIMHAIFDSGFTYCTPIQAQALPHTLAGKDATGRAQTGTGKTAAFLITIFTRLLRTTPPGKRRHGTPRALILAPTRELVLQIVEDARELTKYCSVTTVAILGGMDYQKQQRQVTEQNVDIIVATPGRLLDFKRQQYVHLDQVEVLVIDEADRMLDMGFIPDIRRILALMPPKRQNLLFSATFAPEIKKLADTLLTSPATVEVAQRNAAAETVTQVVYLVEEKHKREVLASLIRSQNMHQVLVFTRTKLSAERLYRQLERDGIRCAAIHGDKSQIQRTQALNDFKNGEILALVATDVAARGLDIDELPHVVNYELPHVAEDYIHRIGRTGRAGASGDALSLVSPEESRFLADIERLLKRTLPRETPPDSGSAPSRPRRQAAPAPAPAEEEAPPALVSGPAAALAAEKERPPLPPARQQRPQQLAALLGGIPWKRD